MRNQIFLFLSQQHDQKQSLLAEMVFPVYKQVLTIPSLLALIQFSFVAIFPALLFIIFFGNMCYIIFCLFY